MKGASLPPPADLSDRRRRSAGRSRSWKRVSGRNCYTGPPAPWGSVKQASAMPSRVAACWRSLRRRKLSLVVSRLHRGGYFRFPLRQSAERMCCGQSWTIFLDAHPMVSARLLLLDRPVNLIEEGMDVAMRIAELPDSSLIATRIGTDVRRVVVGSPAYLSRYKAITEPANLAAHEIIAFTNFGIDSWSFAACCRVQDPARRTVSSAAHRKHCSSGPRVRDQGARPNPSLFLSHRGSRPQRPIADRPPGCGTSTGARSFADPYRPGFGAQSQGIY